MERKPFVITYPRELGRLFATGFINAPDEIDGVFLFIPD